MSTYMHLGSSTGGNLCVKIVEDHGVFGNLFGNNLRSGGSSQFTSISDAELQLQSVVLTVVHVHDTVNRSYGLDKKTFGHGG
jgi:hypothetical protein